VLPTIGYSERSDLGELTIRMELNYECHRRAARQSRYVPDCSICSLTVVFRLYS
jgi:hypothetical protein